MNGAYHAANDIKDASSTVSDNINEAYHRTMTPMPIIAAPFKLNQIFVNHAPANDINKAFSTVADNINEASHRTKWTAAMSTIAAPLELPIMLLKEISDDNATNQCSNLDDCRKQVPQPLHCDKPSCQLSLVRTLD